MRQGRIGAQDRIASHGLRISGRWLARRTRLKSRQRPKKLVGLGCLAGGVRQRNADFRLLFAARHRDGDVRTGGKWSGRTQVDPGIRCCQPDDTAGQISLHPGLHFRSRLQPLGGGAASGSLSYRQRSHRFNHHTIPGCFAQSEIREWRVWPVWDCLPRLDADQGFGRADHAEFGFQPGKAGCRRSNQQKAARALRSRGSMRMRVDPTDSPSYPSGRGERT